MTLRHNAGYLTRERGEAVEAQCLNHIIVGKGAFGPFRSSLIVRRNENCLGSPLVISTL
jgi:hypothetical protein